MRWPLAIVVVLWAAPLSAQSRYKKLCDEHNPKLCAQAVFKSDTVPFDGQLYTTDKAVQQSQKANWCDREIGHAVRQCEALGANRLKLTERLAVIDQIACEESVERLKDHSIDLHEALAESQKRSWTEHPLLWAIVGGTVTAVALFGGAQLTNLAN